jgi:hypothetical protein
VEGRSSKAAEEDWGRAQFYSGKGRQGKGAVLKRQRKIGEGRSSTAAKEDRGRAQF